MKKFIFIFLTLFILTFINAQGIHCGTERWQVKTLSDKDTLSINFNKVTISSVHEQILLTPPNQVKEIPRRNDESIVYKIKCKIIGFRSEKDNDIHIIIADPETNETMIAEVPSSLCDGIQGTSRFEQFEALNQWFGENIGEPTRALKKLKDPPIVILTGIGFFDFNHGQTGRADNGREIHPVLSMEVVEPGALLSNLPILNNQTKSNVATNNSSTTNSSNIMESTPINTLIIIILGAILGMVGQGLRVIVGIKKIGDEATSAGLNQKDLIKTQQLVLSLFIAFAIGAIAGVLAAVGSTDLQFSKSTVFAFIAAGYAGTDFIEGFIRKNPSITLKNNNILSQIVDRESNL